MTTSVSQRADRFFDSIPEKIRLYQQPFPLVSWVLAALVWALSLQGVPIREMTDIGLLSVLAASF